MKEVIDTLKQSIATGGKYLSFNLKQEEYGIAILKIKEIIGVATITPIPQAPHYVKGVINLRDKVIPIVDLRLRFEMPEEEYTERTCIIVLETRADALLVGDNDSQQIKGQAATREIGVVVDSVSEVLHIKAENIEPAPSFGATVDTQYIEGMAKLDGGVKILLDIDSVLNDWGDVRQNAA